MGELIDLAERRQALRPPPRAPRALPPRAFYFDLTCPFSYLDGDRLERALGAASWRPAPSLLGAPAIASPLLREQAERLAETRRLPLTWPEPYESAALELHRVAAYASDAGYGSRFALAALRLAFAGGFSFGDPSLLETSADAAGIERDRCLAAAGDPRWDAALSANAGELALAGLAQAPAIRVGDEWFSGEHALEDAVLELSAPLSGFGSLA